MFALIKFDVRYDHSDIYWDADMEAHTYGAQLNETIMSRSWFLLLKIQTQNKTWTKWINLKKLLLIDLSLTKQLHSGGSQLDRTFTYEHQRSEYMGHPHFLDKKL